MPPNAISEQLFFKIFWEGHAPDSYHWQAMYAQLIVLCAITSYSQSNASLYLCDHTRFRKPSRKPPTGTMYFEQLCMYISDCALPLESLDPPLFYPLAPCELDLMHIINLHLLPLSSCNQQSVEVLPLYILTNLDLPNLVYFLENH